MNESHEKCLVQCLAQSRSNLKAAHKYEFVRKVMFKYHFKILEISGLFNRYILLFGNKSEKN